MPSFISTRISRLPSSLTAPVSASIRAFTLSNDTRMVSRRSRKSLRRSTLVLVGDALLVLEEQCDQLVAGPHDADRHSAIRGEGVTLHGNRAGLRGGHFQNVVIPPGLALEVLAAVNGGAMLAVGDVV